MEPLTKGYTSGTHRLIEPECTFARLKPHLATMGVTRCADVTGLDRIGIPVYCAIRPWGRVIQVTNGKGLRHIDAKVSALMEALEIFHAENPSSDLKRGSLKLMQGTGQRVVQPEILPEYKAKNFFSSDFIIDWIKAEDLLTGEEVWLPASAVYICSPMLYPFDTNGLASGNHLLEATLHGLYEVIERDAISRLSANGRICLTQERCKCIDLSTVDDESVKGLYEMLLQADIKLVLIWVKSCIPSFHTFWAVLLDRNPFSHSSMVNIGYGSHLNVSVAATRAITEAAQSRLTFIHGSREDLAVKACYTSSNVASKVYAYFNLIESNTNWRTLSDMAGDSLLQDYTQILESLSQTDNKNIFRVNLTQPPFNIPVVKVFVSGLKMNDRLF
ncbi:YcaO-like family protein [Desmonostoc muscorum LEGE 12446]|uniref:YcaO-like family protein n=1 Tax=Desmonostoc muscorum LEGE 12446 TaxID=1828758 RepID=A0A8J7DCY0_DESMC|nr:YcaO-like family protein [Desmonostoc muscorum]MCF2147140.1 YcaO-like family protein [Desmonostoc muscorum LEGE 12446]